jgi:hypothetical protein
VTRYRESLPLYRPRAPVPSPRAALTARQSSCLWPTEPCISPHPIESRRCWGSGFGILSDDQSRPLCRRPRPGRLAGDAVSPRKWPLCAGSEYPSGPIGAFIERPILFLPDGGATSLDWPALCGVQPCRAGLRARPEDYRYSRAGAYPAGKRRS